MAGAPYRIVYERNDGQRFYYAREVEHSINGISGTKPFFSADVREASKFQTPTQAIGRRDFLRQKFPKEKLFIESVQGGDPLFDDRSNEVSRTEAPAIRQNYQADGILIVAGQASGYYIRFPGSTFESIRGETPDEAYARYREQLALRPQLAQHVEKAPDISDEQLATTIRNAQDEIRRAALGPGRMRPGNR